jgi:hypothetical protein
MKGIEELSYEGSFVSGIIENFDNKYKEDIKITLGCILEKATGHNFSIYEGSKYISTIEKLPEDIISELKKVLKQFVINNFKTYYKIEVTYRGGVSIYAPPGKKSYLDLIGDKEISNMQKIESICCPKDYLNSNYDMPDDQCTSSRLYFESNDIGRISKKIQETP